MDSFNNSSELPTYTLTLHTEGMANQFYTFPNEKLRYAGFLKLLQESTQTSDGRARKFIFETITTRSTTPSQRSYAGFWCGCAKNCTALEATEKSLH